MVEGHARLHGGKEEPLALYTLEVSENVEQDCQAYYEASQHDMASLFLAVWVPDPSRAARSVNVCRRVRVTVLSAA